MSSVKQLAEKEAHKGYVRNVLTNDHFRFVSAAQNRRWWTYLVALCVMVIFVRLNLRFSFSHSIRFFADCQYLHAPSLFPFPNLSVHQ